MKKIKNIKFTLTALALGLASSVSMADLPPLVENAAVPAPMMTNSLAPMLERVLPAVVSISVEGTQKANRRKFDIPEEFRFFFGDDFFGDSRSSSRKFRGIGSGVIINAEKGYVITNNHVIDGADKITVALNDGREFKAKVLGKDSQSDVALVQIENPSKLTAVKLADSDKLRVGDFAVAIGNPFGVGQTATSGIISALGRSTGSDSGAYENYIQTDAAVNQGNSGGPLVNLNGELIGINTAIISPSGSNAGIAFAIPSNMANNLVQQIIEFGEVRRGQLGIKGGELNADLAKAFNVDAQRGAFVSEVMPGSAAEKAGIKAGDVITELNGQRISSFAELRAKIATSGAGKQLELTLLREGKTEKVKVTLQAEDGKTAQTDGSEGTAIAALEGAELHNGKDGIEIKEVKANSPAAARGLKAGDVIIGVNRQSVATIADLRKILDDKPSAVALNIVRGDSNFYLLIQ